MNVVSSLNPENILSQQAIIDIFTPHGIPTVISIKIYEVYRQVILGQAQAEVLVKAKEFAKITTPLRQIRCFSWIAADDSRPNPHDLRKKREDRTATLFFRKS